MPSDETEVPLCKHRLCTGFTSYITQGEEIDIAHDNVRTPNIMLAHVYSFCEATSKR